MWLLNILVVFICILYWPSFSKADIITDPFALKQLFLAEVKIVKVFENLDLKSNIKNFNLRNSIKEYMQDSKTFIEELEMPIAKFNPVSYDDTLMNKIVGNPIHVFQLLKRLTQKLEDITKWIKKEKITELLSSISKIKSKYAWCNEEDFEFSILSLARIQATYRLSTLSIANGVLLGIKTGARLNHKDCHLIAISRLDKKRLRTQLKSNSVEYALAIEWLEAAIHLAKAQPKASTKSNQKEVKEWTQLLLETRKKHDENFRGMSRGDGGSNLPNEEYFISKIGQDLTVTGESLRVTEEKYFRNSRYSTPPGNDKTYQVRDFDFLCRGLKLRFKNGFQPYPNAQCQLSHKNAPFFILHPLKVETLSLNPEIVAFHDFVNDAEINYIKSQAKRKFARAVTDDLVKGGTKIIPTRTQASTWIMDHKPAELRRLNQRLDLATGLRVVEFMKDSEPLQVGIYGPGGLYLTHLDAFQLNSSYFNTINNQVFIGNRIATALFYLNGDVIGGGTAFPGASVAAFPQKGSVVFWYNLYSDGVINNFTRHGACPTVLGIKWVGNKWIKEGPQIFRRPCTEKSNPKSK